MHASKRPDQNAPEDLTQLLAEALRARRYIKDHPEPVTPAGEALEGEAPDLLETRGEYDFMDMDPGEIRQLINQALNSDDDDDE